jgi:hypothetical protein
MITSTTSNKLAEIIQDTWPQLYRPMKPPEELKRIINIKKNR